MKDDWLEDRSGAEGATPEPHAEVEQGGSGGSSRSEGGTGRRGNRGKRQKIWRVEEDELDQVSDNTSKNNDDIVHDEIGDRQALPGQPTDRIFKEVGEGLGAGGIFLTEVDGREEERPRQHLHGVQQ